MNDFTKESLEVMETIEYWVGEAKQIQEMRDDDCICSSFSIAAYLRSFYLKGKKHGVWISHNASRD